MIINLNYGRTGYPVDLADHYNVDIIETKWIDPVSDQTKAVSEALKNPFNSKALRSMVSGNSKIGIIFSDITRATPYNVILPALLNELEDVPRDNICFYCANGTHRLASDEELLGILGGSVINNYKIIQNVAHDSELFEYVGTTASGNRILLNREILQCDIKILTGFIEPHFFAGFSGGGKALIPGMAFVDTIKYNHSIKHLSDENVKWGITYGNQVWEEIMEAAEFVPGLFLLNISMNRKKEITNVFAGNLREAHRAGCEFVKKSAMVRADRLYDIVITSNSGYPLDLNIYQAVKGMSAAAQIVKEGGHIIIAAECWDGIPSNSDYERILNSVKGPDDLMRYVIENEDSLNDTWQIYFQALIQQKANVSLFSDRLDKRIIKKTFFNPVQDIGAYINDLVIKTGPDTRICVLPEGPQTIPYI